jgi:TIR domain
VSINSIQTAARAADGSLGGVPAASRGLVFLSHSSRERDETELGPGDSLNNHRYRKKYLGQLLGELGDQLKAAGFQPWLDRTDLGAGERFDTLIYDALYRCRAAVILIDRDTLDSNYVAKEATILVWRQTVGDPVYLLPVLLGGVTEAEVKESRLGRQSGIDRLSSIRAASRKLNGPAARETAMQISGKVANGAFGLDSLDSPKLRWIDDVSHYLSGASDSALLRAARTIGVEQHAWHRTARKREAIAAALLSCDIRKTFKVLQGLLHQLDTDRAKKTVRHAEPLWVDLNAARVVMEANDLPAEARIVGLTTDSLEYGAHLARRATACAPEYPVCKFPVVSGENPVRELVRRYDHTLRELLNVPPHATSEEMAGYLDYSQGIYVVMRCDTHSPKTLQAVMDELHRRFPGIVVIAVAGPQRPIWRSVRFRQAYARFAQKEEDMAAWYTNSLRDLANVPREVQW